ncbi:3-oxoacyl-ACP reductase FabG [Myxococcota bacterium]|nr:3-oxoacyl-ACP reductase FabG [Myxococcota bacterium]
MGSETGKLSGKVALVTGGSRGIGAAIAKRLAEEGAAVAITYVSGKNGADEVVASIEARGGTARALQADSSDVNAVTAAVREVARAFGRLDILINNAGVFITGPVNDPAANIEAFSRQQAINVGGVVAAVREATRFMGEGGRIISIGSGLGDRSPWPGLGDYGATKAAIAAYTRGWARDLGSKGITVNTVQPGPVDTEMNPATGDFSAAQKAMTALGRYGKPEEVAAAVAFLASPDAAYITGTTLDVDGGFGA